MQRVTAGQQPKPLPMVQPGPGQRGTLSSSGMVADSQILNVLENILGGLEN